MDPLALLVVAGCLVVFALSSGWIRRAGLTSAIFFVAAGALIGPDALDLCDLAPDTDLVDVVAETTLILVLFGDATRISFARLREGFAVPLRMLAIGLPLAIVFGTLAAHLPLPSSAGWSGAALLAAILAPTDAALGQAVITDPSVPQRIRQAVNVESGLNDGIALPAVLFFATWATTASPDAASVHAGDGMWTTFLFHQLGYGPVVGIGIGVAGGIAIRAARAVGAVVRGTEVFAGLGIALAAWAAAEQLGGNGFLAAFLGGIALGNTAPDGCRSMHEFLENEGQLLTFLSFLLFGAAFAIPALAQATPAVYLHAIVSLTLVRGAAIGISLIGTGLALPSVLFLGWFGPRGLATILFGLLVLEQSSVGERVFAAASATVVLSVVLHGLTAAPFARWYGSWARAHGGEAESMSAPDMPTRVFGPSATRSRA